MTMFILNNLINAVKNIDQNKYQIYYIYDNNRISFWIIRKYSLFAKTIFTTKK